MQFRVLGPLECRAGDGPPVRLGARKHRVLLATLLLSANRWVESDQLVEALWSGRPPPSVDSALRTYVSALRGTLRLGTPAAPARIAARRGGYRLEVPPDELDTLVFEELTARGLKALADGDAGQAAQRLDRAIGLWRGRLLEDVPVNGMEAEAARLEELRLGALESCVEARLALGRHADVLAELAGPVAGEPLRERLQGLWMTALYRGGQRVEALATYRRLRTRLVDELGVEPGAPLRDLHQRMLRADPDLEPPTPAPDPVVPRQLPPDVAWFTGRQPELSTVDDLAPVGGVPTIVAIDGVAGVGKSALAVHAAHRLPGGTRTGTCTPT